VESLKLLAWSGFSACLNAQNLVQTGSGDCLSLSFKRIPGKGAGASQESGVKKVQSVQVEEHSKVLAAEAQKEPASLIW
jgi:hypothetical protein